MEAWARRRPIIATNIQGPKELIRDRENGLLVPVNDPQALAHSIKQVLSSPEMAINLAERGLDTYNGQFSESIVVRRYLEFFNQVVN